MTVAGTTVLRRKGREIQSEALVVRGHQLVVTGHLLKTCSLQDEWYQDLSDPLRLVQELILDPPSADVFTFIIRPSDEAGEDLYFHRDLDNVAAAKISDYEAWWSGIGSKTRALVRKAQKSGVRVKVVELDEAMLAGIERIYNETPVRQGKPFWHYRKDRDYLRRLHATYPDRSDFLAAYVEGELAGFVKLVYTGRTANTMHIISMNAHRDKAVNNALIAKSVEVCAGRGCNLLVYDKFDYESGGSATLQQFKRNNGFERLNYPRYYVPLTLKGRLAIRFGLEKGLVVALPRPLVAKMVEWRNRWYMRNYGSA